MAEEHDELNTLMAKNWEPGDEYDDEPEDDDDGPWPARNHHLTSVDDDNEDKNRGRVVQWSTSDDVIWVPTAPTKPILKPGAYTIGMSNNIGIFFERVTVKTEDLLRLPSTNLEKVITEIAKFWEREKKFKDYNMAHKRGILLWGPAGCGKSSCIQLLMKDVVDRGGIVINFTNPTLFLEGYRLLRQIESEVPVVVIMEDMDAILRNWEESTVLNILDGFEEMKKTVFVATTNYPERLGPRIVNRPSRFDKRFKVGFPSAKSRELYLRFIAKEEPQVNIVQWVKDSEGFSLAHLKELFTAVVILDDDYKEAIDTLKTMIENVPHSKNDADPGENEYVAPESGQYI